MDPHINTPTEGFRDRPQFSDDVESQPLEGGDGRVPPIQKRDELEYGISTNIKILYLGFYFFLNLFLTIYNKTILGSFHFPWLLTFLHTASAFFGCYCMMLKGMFKLTRLGTKENLILVAFSTLFTVNIAISNVSLDMVSVPFHQIIRSTTPIFTVLIYRICFARTYSDETYQSLIPIIAGVALTTYGDYYFTAVGFSLTILGTVLAALKTVAINRLLTGSLALPALELLLRMSPLAALQALFYSFLTGEMSRFMTFTAEGHLTRSLYLALAGNGVLAFCLNVSSFQTNKVAGALTMTVCANLKQCLTVLLGIALFNVQVGKVNGVGMLIALAGAAWYSKVELSSKSQKKPSTQDKDQLLPGVDEGLKS